MTLVRWQRVALAWVGVTLYSGLAHLLLTEKPAAFEQGRAHLLAGELEPAITSLQRYLDENAMAREGERARLLIGKAQLGLGRLDAAEAAFRSLEGSGSLEGHKARYKLALIALYRGEDRPDRLFQKCAEAKDGPLTPEAEAMARWLSGDPAPEFPGSLTGGPASGKHPLQRGRELVGQGAYRAAYPWLERRVSSHANASFFQGKACLGLGQLDRAAERFQMTSRLFGRDEAAHKARFKLALIHLLRGDDEACAAFEAIAAAGKDPGPLVPEAMAWVRFLESKPQGGPR